MLPLRHAASHPVLPFRWPAASALAALLLAGCTAKPVAQLPATPAKAAITRVAPEATAEQRAIFASCLASLRPSALAAGISSDSYARHTEDLQPDVSVLGHLDRQPEFTLPIWDYLSGLVDEERVELGRTRLAEHGETLARISQRFGVPAEAVVAVWGVESNFGQTTGTYPLLQSLGTLSCMGRRQPFFRGEFLATLRILQAGDVAPERLIGSWAGAFGQTQFMPTTYERLAIDFDGDGRRDLVDSTPDALASTANFLKQARWQSGLPWGVEVRLPQGFVSAGESRRNKRSLADWTARGVQRVDGTPLIPAATSTPATLAADTPAGLLLPAGINGPAFLVTRNFDAFYSYNAAESYGLAIAHLSDRLRGEAAFVTAWPTDDPGLSRVERRELQTLLLQRGHDIGEVDGRLGERSRAAIRIEQEKLGQPATGRGGLKILVALRGE